MLPPSPRRPFPSSTFQHVLASKLKDRRCLESKQRGDCTSSDLFVAATHARPQSTSADDRSPPVVYSAIPSARGLPGGRRPPLPGTSRWQANRGRNCDPQRWARRADDPSTHPPVVRADDGSGARRYRARHAALAHAFPPNVRFSDRTMRFRAPQRCRRPRSAHGQPPHQQFFQSPPVGARQRTTSGCVTCSDGLNSGSMPPRRVDPNNDPI